MRPLQHEKAAPSVGMRQMIMTKENSQNYLSEIKEVIDRLPLEGLMEIVNLILTAYKKNKQIFVFGNGGSASTASHFACDINKTVSLNQEKRFKVICLNDNLPTLLAYANDGSYQDIFLEQLKNFLQPNDVVIGISGSGNSENVVRAIQYANENSAESIALTGFDGGKLAKTAKSSVIIPVDDLQKVEDLHLIMVHMIMRIASESAGQVPAIHRNRLF